MKVLLDICCGPCSTHVIEELKEHDLTAIFPNSNIFPKDEYTKRLSEADKIIETSSLGYDYEDWLKFIKGLENEPEGGKRCEKCFEYRFLKTAKYAQENGFEVYTTTLSVSPFKNSEKINEIGKKVAKKFNITFLESNFKKNNGYKKSIDLSKKYGLYRQKYCGCEFSLK